VRRLTDQEGQKLHQIVRRGSTSSVRYRRAMMLLASAGGNRVPVIAKLVQADEDTVRDVIHRFNEIGLACLDPRWAGGRPRLLSPDDEDFVVQTATTRPTRHYGACSPAAASPSNAPRPGRSRPTPSAKPSWTASRRCWNASRTACSLSTSSDRSASAPPAGAGWAPAGHPERHPATYHCTHGVRYFHDS
jgi:transposase